jgi:hypothetical protein
MRSGGLFLLAVFLTGACASRPEPKEHFTLPEDSVARRVIQTRRFDTRDELKILRACAALLQDLGFEIDEGDSGAGLLVASKFRTAVEGDQVFWAVVIGVIAGADVPYDSQQKLRASVVTRPFGDRRESIAVRVTFQRIVWNTHGIITVMEGLDQPEFYQKFFAKLSKSVFLEAHGI